MVNEFSDSLAVLFYLNTKSHILTNCYDYHWATSKIQDLRGYVKNGRALVAGYFLDNCLVGFMWVFPLDNELAQQYEINAITVFPEYRGKLIGTQLFRYVEKILSQTSATLITQVDAANIGAYKFYIEHGMSEKCLQLTKSVLR